jgi:hypothetical protein
MPLVYPGECTFPDCPHREEREVHENGHWSECVYAADCAAHPWTPEPGEATPYIPTPAPARLNIYTRPAVARRTPRVMTVPEALLQDEHLPTDANCGCEAHKLARFEDSKLSRAVIHSYSYSPSPWRLKSVKGEENPYYLGVELETDNYSSINPRGGSVPVTRRSMVATEMAADMRRPYNHWVPKHDSSVSGPEFASHPATLKWWRKNRARVAEMMQMLLHAGYRSHENDHCGMHINISRSAFESAKHLYRFLSLIHANPRWSMRMAQRTEDSARQWAKLDARNVDERTCEDLVQGPVSRQEPVTDWFTGQPMLNRDGTPRMRTVQSGDWNGTGDRYVALNAPYSEPRFEFRLPRGTLRIDRFFKNLEWTVGMIEYTRSCKLKDATPRKFMAWAIANAKTYPDLVAFLKERFGTEVFTGEPEPVAAEPEPVAVPEPAPTTDELVAVLASAFDNIPVVPESGYDRGIANEAVETAEPERCAAPDCRHPSDRSMHIESRRAAHFQRDGGCLLGGTFHEWVDADPWASLHEDAATNHLGDLNNAQRCPSCNPVLRAAEQARLTNTVNPFLVNTTS